MKNFKPIRLQLLMAILSVFSASPKSIDVAENFENALTYGKVSFTDLVPCYVGNKPSISSMNINYWTGGKQVKIKYSVAAPVIFEGEAVKPNGEIRSLLEVYKQTLNN